MTNDMKLGKILLEDVRRDVKKTLGDALSYRQLGEKSSTVSHFCQEKIRECNIAIDEEENDDNLMFEILRLKAQLYGCWREKHKKALDCYEKALLIDKRSNDTYYRYAVYLKYSNLKGSERVNYLLEQAIGFSDDEKLSEKYEKEMMKGETGCFIATAVYGSSSSPEVMKLRRFRDEQIQHYFFGRLFIQLYYRVSPIMAEYIKDKDLWKTFLRKKVLDRIVGRLP